MPTNEKYLSFLSIIFMEIIHVLNQVKLIWLSLVLWDLLKVTYTPCRGLTCFQGFYMCVTPEQNRLSSHQLTCLVCNYLFYVYHYIMSLLFLFSVVVISTSLIIFSCHMLVLGFFFSSAYPYSIYIKKHAIIPTVGIAFKNHIWMRMWCKVNMAFCICCAKLPFGIMCLFA